MTKPLWDVRSVTDFKDLLTQSAELFGDKDAYRIKNSDGEYYGITYKEHKEDVDALGTSLLAMGLKNESIAVIGENRYEWCTTYLAVTGGVGIIVPLDKELPIDELKNLIKRSNVKAIVFSGKFNSVMQELKNENNNLKYYIDMDLESEENDILSFKKLIANGKKLIAGGDKKYLNAKIDPEKMAILLFTSGTTDLAKGVMLSTKNILTNIMAISSVIPISENDRVLSILPLHHTYECTADFLTPIYKGVTIHFNEGLKYIGKNLQEVKPTFVLVVPLILESIHKKIWATINKENKTGKVKTALKLTGFMNNYFKIDLTKNVFKDIHKFLGGSIKFLIVGGAAPDNDVIKDLREFGITVRQGYGLTETSPIIAVNQLKKYKDAAAGLPLPGLEVKIHEPDEEGIGEIKVKGDSIMLGYYQNEEATNNVLKKGWLYTGDLGYMDKDGFLHITGRQKNVIVTRNGKNIFPEEVEAYLNKSEYIKECIVYGKEHKDDTMVCALIHPDFDLVKSALSKNEITDEEVYNFIKAEVKKINKDMPLYKKVKTIEIRKEEFIKTTTKKIKRNANINNN